MKKLIYLIALTLAFMTTSCYAEASVCDEVYESSVTVQDDGVSVYFTYYYDPAYPNYYWMWDLETSMWRWYYYVTPPRHWSYWPGRPFFGGPRPHMHHGRPYFRPGDGPHHRPYGGRPGHRGGHQNYGGHHNHGGYGGGVTPRPNNGKPNGGYGPRPGGGRPNGGYRPGTGGRPSRPGGGYNHGPGNRSGGGSHGNGGGPRRGGRH